MLAEIFHPPSDRPASYEDFLNWHPEDSQAEFVCGDFLLMSPPSIEHQNLVAFLHRVLADFVEHHEAGLVLIAPTQMRLKSHDAGREPDVLFLAKDNPSEVKELYIDGPADLAVEVTGPNSRVRDRVEKFHEYAAAGIKEYWLVDLQEKRFSLFVLKDGAYQPVQPHEEDGILPSVVLPGLWLDPEWLWHSPLPRLREIRRQLGI